MGNLQGIRKKVVKFFLVILMPFYLPSMHSVYNQRCKSIFINVD